MSVARRAEPHELALCLEIRRAVFVAEQGVAEEIEIDGKDGDCVHVIALDAGRPAGTARLRVTADGLAKVERVAVLASHRGRSIGAALMDVLEAEAARLGHREVVLSSQMRAVPFYERLGYQATGPEYLEAGIPHRRMTKTLRRS
jgi:predicted GNAT family N-acyltransferase